MRVLVTGGTGFLGRHTVARLVERGHRVDFCGRDAARGREVSLATGARFTRATLDQPGEAARVCRNVEAIVHCAAHAAPWGSRSLFARANVEVTRSLLDAAKAAGAQRFVHISTPSVYAAYADRLDVREDDPLPPPINDYAATKAQADSLVLAEGSLETIILRPRALIGPYDTQIGPRLIGALRRGRFPVTRGGTAMIDLTCVQNAAEAAALALELRGLARGRVYNVSNGDPRPLKDILTIFFESLAMRYRPRAVPYWLAASAAWLQERWALAITGKEPALTRYGVGALAFSLTLNIERARRELGYMPGCSVEQGIAAFASWWKAAAG
jgi:nucleoside-diphosphate-sugar epimerase